MEWVIFHKYRNLCGEGKALPILCPDCEFPLLTRIRGKDDSPWFWCPVCDAFIKPGLDTYQKMRAVVTEHFI